MNQNNKPLVIPVILFALGITLAEHIPLIADMYPSWGAGLLCAFTAVLMLFRVSKMLTTCLLLLLFVPAGILRHSCAIKPINELLNNNTDSAPVLEGKILSRAHTPRYIKLEVRIVRQAANNRSYDNPGVLLYVSKEADCFLPVLDFIRFRNKLQAIPPQLNPLAFDYRKYLQRKKIHYRAYLECGDIITFSFAHDNTIWTTLSRWLADARQYVYNNMVQDISDSQTRAIAASMILGDREELPAETRQGFIDTGCMHLLAVSGLHVGIVFLCVNLIFRFITSHHLLLMLPRMMIVISLIWLYVVLTGAAPSAVRAGIMCSLYFIGRQFSRYMNPYNILAAAAGIMLFLNPASLFSIGFQFSFLALLGIFVFYSPMKQLCLLQDRLLGSITKLILISLSAQLGVAPLAAYYFHQFAPSFILSSVLVAPFTGIIIIAGLGKVILASTPLFLFAKPVCSTILDTTLHYIRWMVVNIQKLPGASITHIYLDLVTLGLCYLAVICLAIVLYRSEKFWLWVSLASLLIIPVFMIYQKHSVWDRTVITCYAGSQSNCIDIFSKGRALTFCPQDRNTSYTRFNADKWRRSHYIQSIRSMEGLVDQAPLEFCFHGKSVLLTGPHPLTDYQTEQHYEYVLVTHPEAFSVSAMPYCDVIVGHDLLADKKERIYQKCIVYHNIEESGPYIQNLSPKY